MTNKRLDAIRQRLEMSQRFAHIREDNEEYVGIGNFYLHDVTYLLSLVEKQRSILTDIGGLHHNCGQCNCALTSGESQCETYQLAEQALKCDEGGEVGE